MGELNDLLRDVNSSITRRSKHIDRWAALARAKPDPETWLNALINSALQRLDQGDHDAATIEAARRELLDIQSDVLAKIRQRPSGGTLPGIVATVAAFLLVVATVTPDGV